jgi:CheY-like chemotaxis protein
MPNEWADWSHVATENHGRPSSLGGVVGQVVHEALPMGGPQAFECYAYDDHNEGTTRLAFGCVNNVEIAGSGEQAMQILEKGAFSLMLCDVRMPGMTGVQLVPLARERDQDIAIIMLTAVNDAATATEVLSAGASDELGRMLCRALHVEVDPAHDRPGGRD